MTILTLSSLRRCLYAKMLVHLKEIMEFLPFALLAAVFIFTGCSYAPPPPVVVDQPKEKIDYLTDVQPILNKRCVVCHSCYNSPCQLKLSAFEGADRGATKAMVYDASRLYAQHPTRLFIDANSTRQWRDKNFFSVTTSTAGGNRNNSILAHLLHQKAQHPLSAGAYRPEADRLTCAKDTREVAAYLDKHPNRGMPYGFPSLSDREYRTLLGWLQQGAQGPTHEEQRALTTPSPEAAKQIAKWEHLLNAPNAKHKMTARYLYEHLFLAHLHFPDAPNEFFEIVRSRTPSPQPIDVIATIRPYDDPRGRFYYRIRKIHSTIMHKTHIVFEMDERQYDMVVSLFIDTPWEEPPHAMDYAAQRSANPFTTYAQIPPASRYRFLLHNNEYITRTFIRGPVCRGQIALNVIHDHFWVLFTDPEHDLTVQHPKFLAAQAAHLRMPIEEGSTMNVFSVFSDRYRDYFRAFMQDKEQLYRQQGVRLTMDYIWPGDTSRDTPMLTVYRHFDSATVRKGALGQLPRTAWVIDYPQFEAIYYALVAGFDVFGNMSHQSNVRRYMDFLRMEGEQNFIAFLPKEKGLGILKSWYLNDHAYDDLKGHEYSVPTDIVYHTDDPEREFIEKVVHTHLLKSTHIDFDHNYLGADARVPTRLPEQYVSWEDYLQALHVVSRPGTTFMRVVNDYNANLALIRVIGNDGTNWVVTMVINRWHDNVNAMFGEHDRLDPAKDTVDFIEGSLGSYPNLFFVVKEDDLPDFFDLLQTYKNTRPYLQRLHRYAVFRSDPEFWKQFDWFQRRFEREQPLQSGLYDLNRYYYWAGQSAPVPRQESQ